MFVMLSFFRLVMRQMDALFPALVSLGMFRHFGVPFFPVVFDFVLGMGRFLVGRGCGRLGLLLPGLRHVHAVHVVLS